MANLYRNPDGTIARRRDGKLMRAPTQQEFEDCCCASPYYPLVWYRYVDPSMQTYEAVRQDTGATVYSPGNTGAIFPVIKLDRLNRAYYITSYDGSTQIQVVYLPNYPPYTSSAGYNIAAGTRPQDLAIGADHSVYMVGVDDFGLYDKWKVRRIRQDGSEIWDTGHVFGKRSSYFWPPLVSTDATGNVFLSAPPNTYEDTYSEYDLYKISVDGQLLWSKYIRQVIGYEESLDEFSPISLAVDAAGNAYVSGDFYKERAGSCESGIFIVKFSPAGDEVWRVERTDFIYPGDGRSCRIDVMGDYIVATGFLKDVGGGYFQVAAGFSSETGQELWTYETQRYGTYVWVGGGVSIADGVAFIVTYSSGGISYRGHLFALDVTNGDLVWETAPRYWSAGNAIAARFTP